jgi:tetratricopeptide (TPR) repeat protein
MRKLSILVGVCIAAISWGCATTPEPDEPEEPERSESVSLEREANTLTRARELIGVASPASLHVAYAEIRASDAAKTERGLELAYTAFKILQIAYPHALDDLIEVFPPAAGIGNRMFQEIEAGRYPEVETADVSYFTLLIPPLSILFTADVEVETRSLETIEQAMQVNPDSVLPVYLRGVIARRRGELVAAEGFFESALDKDSSCYPASVGAAEISLDTGDIDTANRHLESFREYIRSEERRVGKEV